MITQIINIYLNSFPVPIKIKEKLKSFIRKLLNKDHE